MLSMRTIADRVRAKLHDEDKVTYADTSIANTLNDGIRFIRRTITQIQPEILATTATGTIEAGQTSIDLPTRPLAIVEVLAGDKVKKVVVDRNSPKIYKNKTKIYKSKLKLNTEITTVYYEERPLHDTNLRHIYNRERVGTPGAYYRTGIKTVNFFPIPKKITGYTVRYIEDLDELTLSDNSPLINDFDDFLIEYAALRLSVGNEYDMTAETQIMSVITSQIQQILAPPPPGVDVLGYWDTAARYSDSYDRRRRYQCF